MWLGVGMFYWSWIGLPLDICTCISWHLHNPCFIVPHNVLVTLYSRTSLIQNTLGALLMIFMDILVFIN